MFIKQKNYVVFGIKGSWHIVWRPPDPFMTLLRKYLRLEIGCKRTYSFGSRATLLVKVLNIWLLSVPQCIPKMMLFCIKDSLQDKLNWNKSMKPQKMFSKHHEMMWNALKEYWQKYWDSKMWFWPYLPKLLIDDFGIVIGADQVSTNLIIVKQLTLPNIKPLQVKIIPQGTR